MIVRKLTNRELLKKLNEILVFKAELNLWEEEVIESLEESIDEPLSDWFFDECMKIVRRYNEYYCDN